MNLCRKLKKLPKVKAQVEEGTLDYTKARVIVGVADTRNEGAWLTEASGCSRRELERKVRRAKKAAAVAKTGQTSLLPAPAATPVAVVPVRVSLEMTPAQFARYEALWEQIRKQGGVPADKVEALLAVMAGHAEKSTTRVDNRPPVQIHIHQCPHCEKATVTPAPFRQLHGVKFWPEIGTVAKARAAQTRTIWKSITRFHEPGAAPTAKRI